MRDRVRVIYPRTYRKKRETYRPDPRAAPGQFWKTHLYERPEGDLQRCTEWAPCNPCRIARGMDIHIGNS